MDLTGFSAFDFSQGAPYFSVTSNGVTFNKAVTLKLGAPAYVRLLINKETNQIALQVCDENAPQATAFYKAKKREVYSVRWNSQDLLAVFREMLNSDLLHGFRVDGKMVGSDVMLFDLNEAKPLT